MKKKIKKMRIVMKDTNNLSKFNKPKRLQIKILLLKKINNLPMLKMHLRKLNLMNYRSYEKFNDFLSYSAKNICNFNVFMSLSFPLIVSNILLYLLSKSIILENHRIIK